MRIDYANLATTLLAAALLASGYLLLTQRPAPATVAVLPATVAVAQVADAGVEPTPEPGPTEDMRTWTKWEGVDPTKARIACAKVHPRLDTGGANYDMGDATQAEIVRWMALAPVDKLAFLRSCHAESIPTPSPRVTRFVPNDPPAPVVVRPSVRFSAPMRRYWPRPWRRR